MHTGWGCDGNYDLGEIMKGEDVDYDLDDYAVDYDVDVDYNPADQG